MNTPQPSNPFVTAKELAEMSEARALHTAELMKGKRPPPLVPMRETTFEERRNHREMIGRQAMLDKRINKLQQLVQNNENAQFIASHILLVQQTIDQMTEEGQVIDQRVVDIMRTASNIVATRIAASKLLAIKPDLALRNERTGTPRIGFA